MATTTEIPVHVTPEAQARIRELGLEGEFAEMIRHAKESISDLECIEVETWCDYDQPDGDHVSLVAWRKAICAPQETHQLERDWDCWFGAAFPPHILIWFGMNVMSRPNHE